MPEASRKRKSSTGVKARARSGKAERPRSTQERQPEPAAEVLAAQPEYRPEQVSQGLTEPQPEDGGAELVQEVEALTAGSHNGNEEGDETVAQREPATFAELCMSVPAFRRRVISKLIENLH